MAPGPVFCNDGRTGNQRYTHFFDKKLRNSASAESFFKLPDLTTQSFLRVSQSFYTNINIDVGTGGTGGTYPQDFARNKEDPFHF